MEVRLRCDMLVDQSLFIGGDPVGYKCQNPADWKDQDGFLYCETCRLLRETEPERLTKPPAGFGGVEYQKRLAFEVLKAVRLEPQRIVNVFKAREPLEEGKVAFSHQIAPLKDEQ